MSHTRTSLMVLGFTLLAAGAYAQVAALPALVSPVATSEETASAPVAEAARPAVLSVPVLKQGVQKGETITADNVTQLEVPSAQVFVSTIADTATLIGQQAVRPLEAGKPVNRLHVRVAPLVSRNQVVTLVYRKGGIELTGSAQALEDGQAGQTIRIVNPATRSTLNGVVGADGSVEVN